MDDYWHMGHVKCDGVVKSDSMSCLQAIEGKDTKNHLSCHIMNLLWTLSYDGTCVCFCWVPSHCGIGGNEIVDQLAKETLDHAIDLLTSVHYAYLKPLVNIYIQKEVQIKWDISVNGRDLYLLKLTLGPHQKFQQLTGAEEVVITWLLIGHTKAMKSHILSRWPMTTCQHCGLSWLLKTCLSVQCYSKVVMNTTQLVFEMTPEACIVEFLREAGFFYLIWMTKYPVQHLIWISHQMTKFWTKINPRLTIPPDSVIHL